MELFFLLLMALDVVLYLVLKPKRDKVYLLPALLPIGIGLAQGIGQLYQAEQEKKLAQEALNYMPAGLTEATNSARAQTNSQRYAGQDTDEANIRQNTADTFSNVSKSTRSPGTLLNAASQLNTAQARGMNQVGQRAAAFRENAMDKYRNMLLQQSNVQMGNQRYSQALQGAATRNKYNALNSVLGGLATGAQFAKGFGGARNTAPFGQAIGAVQSQQNPFANMFNQGFQF